MHPMTLLFKKWSEIMIKLNSRDGIFRSVISIQTLLLLIGYFAMFGSANADSISDHRVSMTIQSQMLSEVFRKLSSETGFEIIYNESIGNPRISVHIENATIEKALQRILIHSNYTIIYNENKTIQVDIYAGGQPDNRRLSGNSFVRKALRQPLEQSTHEQTTSSQTPVSLFGEKIIHGMGDIEEE